MRIDDALFYAVLDDSVAAGDLETWCRTAAAAGVDIIEAGDAGGFECIRDICRREGILAVAPLDSTGGAALACEAVIVNADEVSVGLARGMVAAGTLAGVRTADLNELILAVETGCDFAVYSGGGNAHEAFAAVRRPGVPLFAGGAKSLEEVGATISAGVFRVAVGAAVLGDISVVRENAAKISRMLGREI